MIESPVTYSSSSYRINGVPAWLASGEMHYFKMARGDWRRRLLQLKLAGFNTVSVYMPWNFHEVTEGAWDFTGEKDVTYFLELAAEMGLYVVARPGPFICDEWQCGGVPSWLSAKPRIRLRTADRQFIDYCDRWWDQIGPIIADYQLGAKGTVILAQVENEYGHLGEQQEADYIYHLRDGLRARGVTVPIINCDSFIRFARLRPRKWDGINLCCNFGGDAIRNLARAREMQPDAPLFVTEYWIAAFDWWGRNGSAMYDDDQAVFGGVQIAAGGAGGLTAFVFSGGAHFAYWHGRSICSDQNFMTTLYGPGAPILDDGSFNGKYARFKRVMTGLMAGEDELAEAGMPEVQEVQPGLVQAVRQGPHAQYQFLINQGTEQLRIADAEKEQAAVDMSIPAGATIWSVKHLPLPAGFTLQDTTANVFCADPALVLYGDAGQSIRTRLVCPNSAQPVTVDGMPVSTDGNEVVLTAQVPTDDEVRSCVVGAGEASVMVLLMNHETVDRSWRIAMPGMQPTVLVGPDRVEDITTTGDVLEVRISVDSVRPCCQVSAESILPVAVSYGNEPEPVHAPLQHVNISREFPEATRAYDAGTWFAADQPQPMATFGHGQGWAWYRTTITVRDAGPQMIMVSGAADRIHLFIDGQYLVARGANTNHGWNTMAYLEQGTYTLAILTENLGMFNTGAEFDIPLGEPKGLFGPVWLNGEELRGWRMRAGIADDEALEYWPEVGNTLSWITNTDESLTGPVWIRAEFDMPDSFDGAVRLNLEKAAGKGCVWLNGRNIGRYWSMGPQQSLWLPLSWLLPHNTLVLFEEIEITPAQVRVDGQPFGTQGSCRLAS